MGPGFEERFLTTPQKSQVSLRYFRIQQLREPRVVDHILEIVIGAGLKPIFRIQLDRLGKVVEAALYASRDRIDQGQAIERVIGLRIIRDNPAPLLSRLFEVAALQ